MLVLVGAPVLVAVSPTPLAESAPPPPLQESASAALANVPPFSDPLKLSYRLRLEEGMGGSWDP